MTMVKFDFISRFGLGRAESWCKPRPQRGGGKKVSLVVKGEGKKVKEVVAGREELHRPGADRGAAGGGGCPDEAAGFLHVSAQLCDLFFRNAYSMIQVCNCLPRGSLP